MSTIKKLAGKGRFSDRGRAKSTAARKNVGQCGGFCSHLWPLHLAKHWQPAGPMWQTGFCRVSPSCCYFVVVIYLQKQSDEMMRRELCLGCQEQPGSCCWRRGFFGGAREGDLAPTWRPTESRSSQRTEGERGRAICGTDMVDVSQMVPGSDGTEADFHLDRIHV